jgi:5,10-methylenetetrahydrofolate reductase
MTKEDIIRMAREAGINVEQGFLLRFAGVEDDLERFAALVAAHEREDCAKVCDDWPNGRDDVYSIGVVIRARGKE